MATRYGHSSFGDVEYYDSKEEFEAAKAATEGREVRAIFGIIGFIAGGIGAYILFRTLGAGDWPKVFRFVAGLAMLASAIGTAFLAALLWKQLSYMLGLTFVVFIGWVIWRIV